MSFIKNANERAPSLALDGFRPEIAGLRAIAVISVVLCHLKVPYFEGGFIGVDVFFVISGFLITRHIASDLSRGTFNFFEFYVRRARRILPALIGTLWISFVVGFLWLDPHAFRGLAKETTHALLSIANIQYWREAHEYFAPAAENLPLLHTWSLSVEEQFYLLWPTFLFLAYRRLDLRIAVLALGTLSLIACAITMRHDSQASFFLTPFRVFEFCVGAACVFYEGRIRGLNIPPLAFTAGGLIAICLSLTFLSPQSQLPGIVSLLPCLGAASIIAGGNTTKFSKLLSNPVAQYIGLFSYSLYLCHWPVIFFTRYIFGAAADTWSAKLAMIAAMVGLASAMEALIERPFRNVSSAQPTRAAALRFVLLTILSAAISHTTFSQNGWAWRLSQGQRELAVQQSFGVHPCKGRVLERCEFGADNGQRSIEVIGDSYSHQYVSGLDLLLKPMGLSGAVTIIGGCPMLLGLTSINPGLDSCKTAQADGFAQIRQMSPFVGVILAQAWGMYTDEYTMTDGEKVPSNSHGVAKLEQAVLKTVALLSQNGRRVLIIGNQVSPKCPIDKSRMARGPLWRAPPGVCPPEKKDDVVQRGQEIDQMLQRVQKQFPSNVSLLKPADRFCDADTCPIVKDGEWLFIDQGHFSVAGSNYMVARTPEFQELVSPVQALSR